MIRLIRSLLSQKESIHTPVSYYLNNPEYVHQGSEIPIKQTPLDKEEPIHRVGFYRILSNVLYPIESIEQNINNLKFILNHEPQFNNWDKCFILNRIYDNNYSENIKTLLEEKNIPYYEIPFKVNEFNNLGWDHTGVPQRFLPWGNDHSRLTSSEKQRVLLRLYRHKINYLMNENGARNFALSDGKEKYNWLLPWHGSTYLTDSAQSLIDDELTKTRLIPIYSVPVHRVCENESIFSENLTPQSHITPELIFSSRSAETFNEDYYFGRRTKIEMLWRLGLSGYWNDLQIEPWDLSFPKIITNQRVAPSVGLAAKLKSESPYNHDDHNLKSDVSKSIISIIDKIDRRNCINHVNHNLEILDDSKSELLKLADSFLSNQLYSVYDKPSAAPRSSKGDYWTPAPFYWPTLPGLPYKRRDGHRRPGTIMYDDESFRYDRTRIQQLFDEVYLLTLAYSFSNNELYSLRAMQLLKRWFIDQETRMNPHLKKAQLRYGYINQNPTGRGIIETKDMYYFLDAVEYLIKDGVIEQKIARQFTTWLEEYLSWLLHSPQGISENCALNNHGTYYDLQVLRISMFLEDIDTIKSVLRNSESRILYQLSSDGTQTHENSRPNVKHYYTFNIQGWLNLCKLANKCGTDLLVVSGKNGESILNSSEWLLNNVGTLPDSSASFDNQRLAPICHDLLTLGQREIVDKVSHIEPSRFLKIKTRFHPHDGIKPFWQYDNILS